MAVSAAYQYFCKRCGTKRGDVADRPHGIGGIAWRCPDCGSHDIGSTQVSSDDKAVLQAKVDALKWYHRIQLPHGITTPGWAPLDVDFYRVDADLAGKRVLDIGTYDGFWAFEALERNASHVTAIDDFSDVIYEGEKRSWEPFDLCADALGPFDTDSLIRMKFDVYDLDSPYIKPFDVVFFFGVLYHCKHPLLALERIRSAMKEGGTLYLESAILDDMSAYRGMGKGYGEEMVMEFLPDDQLAGCKTNWWLPTLNTLGKMVMSAGFKDVQQWKIDAPHEPAYCRGFVRATAA